MTETPINTEHNDIAPAAGEDHAGEQFVGERFFGRKMDGADFTGAELTRAQFKRASFKGATFSEASLCGAQLIHVNLAGARLNGADLRGAQLTNVDLTDADLTGANLVGASLKGVNLDRARLGEARLTGADVETGSFTSTDLTSTLLDGAALESATFKGARLHETSLQGARLGRCTLEDCELDGCDMAGALVDTSLFKGATWSNCNLYGARFHKTRFRGIEIDDCDAAGCRFEDCTGLTPDAEMELAENGALLQIAVGAKLVRMLKENRKLQLAVLVTVAAVLALCVLLVSTPSLWPTWALVSHMEGMSNNPPHDHWCDEYVELGEILATRSMENVQRHNQILVVAAHCYGDQENHEDAERIYLRCVEIASNSTRELHAARLELARYYVTINRMDEAEDVAREIADDPRADATSRLNGLRLREDIQRQRGGAGTAPEEWIALQVRIAEEILANDYETQTAGMLMETPAELFVWGEWELADRLLAWAVPPLSDGDYWSQVSRAIQLADLLDREESALELTEYLMKSERFSEGLYRALLAHETAMLLADKEDTEAIDSLFEGMEETADLELRQVQAVVAVRSFLAADEPAEALAATADLAQNPEELPFPLMELVIWASADANLATKKEEAAIEALKPLVAALEEQDAIDRTTARLMELSGSLEHPELLAEMVESVGNPVLSEFNVVREILLTTLSQEAEAGTLAMDDPRLLQLLDSEDGYIAERAMQMLLRTATAHGEQAAAIEQLTYRAREAAGMTRVAFGLAVMDAEIDRSNAAVAIQLAEELELLGVATGETRARLYGTLIRASLSTGDDEGAVAWLQLATQSTPPIQPDQLGEMIRQIAAHRSERGNPADALALLRANEALIQPTGTNDPLFSDYLYLLYAAGDEANAEAQLTRFGAVASACAVEYQRAAALARAGKAGADHERLVEACARADADDTTRLHVATYLQQAGATAEVLELLEGMKRDQLNLWDRMTAATLEARCLFATDRREDAVNLLDREYVVLVDGESRGSITSTLVDFHAELGDDDGVVRVYSRFASDHPGHLHQGMWDQASRALIQLDAADRVEALASKSEWDEAMQATLAAHEIRALLDSRGFTDAWDFLDRQLKEDPGGQAQEQLLGWAREVRDGSGDNTRFLAFLEDLGEAVSDGSPMASRVALEEADALGSMGRSDEALERLAPLLDDPMDEGTRKRVVQLYARMLGRTQATAEIEAKLAGLSALNLGPAVTQMARLEAAGGLVEQRRHGDARKVLGPLAGTPLAESVGSNYYHIVISAWTEDGLHDEAAELPSRFPGGSSMPGCTAELLVVGALPLETQAFAKLHARILETCDLGALSPNEFMSLVDATAATNADEALAMLGRYSAEAQLTVGEAHTVDVGRARLLTGKGQHAQARDILRRIIGESSDTWVVTGATSALLQGASVPDAGLTPTELQKDVDSALAKVPKGSDEAIQIHRDVVQYHLQGGRQKDALKWQQDLVAAIDGTNGGLGYELLQLARLELTTSGPSSSSWKRNLDEAHELAAGDTELRQNVEVLRTAAAVAGTSTSRATAVVEPALMGMEAEEKTSFIHRIADELEYTLGESERSQAVRGLASQSEPQ